MIVIPAGVKVHLALGCQRYCHFELKRAHSSEQGTAILMLLTRVRMTDRMGFVLSSRTRQHAEEPTFAASSFCRSRARRRVACSLAAASHPWTPNCSRTRLSPGSCTIVWRSRSSPLASPLRRWRGPARAVRRRALPERFIALIPKV
jgi:hypothetical protein